MSGVQSQLFLLREQQERAENQGRTLYEIEADKYLAMAKYDRTARLEAKYDYLLEEYLTTGNDYALIKYYKATQQHELAASTRQQAEERERQQIQDIDSAFRGFVITVWVGKATASRPVMPIRQPNGFVFNANSPRGPGWDNSLPSSGVSPDAYAGVREASKYLKEAGVPRNIRKQVLESFDRESMRVRVAGEAEFGIRYYDNNVAYAKGRFLFDQFPATRDSLALPSDWNQMTHFKQFHIRPGTPILEGAAAPQGFYRGGQSQMWIRDLDNLID